jgi:putative transposase
MIKKILIMLSDKSNILTRSTISAPFQAVSSDVTEIYYGKGKLFLCIHKDVVGQLVYGYSIGVKPNLELVLQSLNLAIDKIKNKLGFIPKRIIFHQDRGTVYTGYGYVDKVLGVGKISFSAPGTPTDNSGQESFFGRFKEEWADEIRQIDDQKEAIKFIRSKIKYYNQTRIHTTIGYQSPNCFTNLFLKQLQNQFNKFRT